MKKILHVIGLLIVMMVIFACEKKKVTGTMSLGGKEYDAKYVISGYYFDKASLSEATLGEMLEKTEAIDKPESLGETILPDFSTIELTNNRKEEITDAMIEAEIEKERDKETSYTPVKVKRDAKMTDKVKIDFKGYVNGVELEGGSGEDYDLVLGSNSFIPGFEEKVAGHPAGKKFSINVTFPQDYTAELAGKPAQFDITIKSIEEAHTPEVDDEFVKSHTAKGSTTVAEYKEEIREKLADRQVFLNNQNLMYQLTEKLFELTKFNPSEEALAWQFSVILDEYKKQAKASGTNLATMLTAGGGTIKDAYDEIKSYVPQYIQQAMLTDALSSKFNVTVTKEDVRAWFDTMAGSLSFGNEVSYDDYISYVGYDALAENTKQVKLLLEAIKLCKTVDEVVEE